MLLVNVYLDSEQDLNPMWIRILQRDQKNVGSITSGSSWNLRYAACHEQDLTPMWNKILQRDQKNIGSITSGSSWNLRYAACDKYH